jgi:hypothetical protein
MKVRESSQHILASAHYSVHGSQRKSFATARATISSSQADQSSFATHFDNSTSGNDGIGWSIEALLFDSKSVRLIEIPARTPKCMNKVR